MMGANWSQCVAKLTECLFYLKLQSAYSVLGLQRIHVIVGSILNEFYI